MGLTAIKQADAALQLAEINLRYTTIQSPVDGTIIARRVNIGQTVVSSFSAPSLFLIGKDLSKMQVWVSVNEADVGRIKVGMPVIFSVAALPDEEFQGVVEKIRLNAQSTQNVVAYTVEVNFDNSDRKVMPYLTADPVKFVVDKRSDVLLVPNTRIGVRTPAAGYRPGRRGRITRFDGHFAKSDDAPKTDCARRPTADKREKPAAEKDAGHRDGEKTGGRHGKGIIEPRHPVGQR